MRGDAEAWQTLFEKGPVVWLHRGADYRVLDVSGNTCSLDELGLAPGSDYLARIHPADRQRVRELSVNHEGRELDIEYQLLDRGGQACCVREYSLPDPDLPGTRRGYLILQKASGDTGRVAGRLARCEGELQEFAYIASHDLQEPLRKVQAFGERLQRKYAAELGEQGQDYLARMLNASGRMQGFLHGLLEFSRVVTRGKPPVHCDLNMICAEQVTRLHKRSEELNAIIAVGDLPAIDADLGQMGQLMRHLLDNALKFHMEGIRPVIAVAAELKGDDMELRITDNGMGFSQGDAEKVFQVFQRLHGHGRYAGAGMGLAICRRIVERHGGSIDARAMPGSGATFVILLPLRQTTVESN